MRRAFAFAAVVVAAGLANVAARSPSDSFRFVILGDRTGDTQRGVYERIWKETATDDPAFVLTVGDTIQGLHDESAEAEWAQVTRLLAPYRRIALYLAPGNHDIWSENSEALFRANAGHAPHYSFDYRQAHFTVLDNSRSEQFSSEELVFLEADLRAHAGQTLKFIVSHRPSWVLDVFLGNPNFAVHRLAKKYGVQCVIAGHVHQMIRAELDGVEYLSMPSAGGHLRASKKYEDGWFFAHTAVEVRGADVRMQVKEVSAPYGRGRVTNPRDWGKAGLVERAKGAGA